MAATAHTLSLVSQALIRGYEFSGSPEQMALVIPIPGDPTGLRQIWVAVERNAGIYTITLPNSNWASREIVLSATVNVSHGAWKIIALQLGGRPLTS